MKFKLLEKSGLRVSELGVGTMTFGQDWGTYLNGVPKKESKKIFDLFVDEDKNFIDTANDYQNATSKKYVIGEFIIAHDRKKIWSSYKV